MCFSGLLIVFILNSEEQTVIADGKLRHYCNRRKNLSVPSFGVAVRVLEYSPRLKAAVDCLMAILCAGLRRSSRDDKSREIFVVGLGLSLSTDLIGLDGAL